MASFAPLSRTTTETTTPQGGPGSCAQTSRVQRGLRGSSSVRELDAALAEHGGDFQLPAQRLHVTA
jgi:hypothetical protein